MESVNMKRLHGIAKTTGILLCIAGVVILAFYEGPVLKSIHHNQLLMTHGATNGISTTHSKNKWILGIFLMTLSVSSWSLWAVLQVTF
jgi:hypothetical protein